MNDKLNFSKKDLLFIYSILFLAKSQLSDRLSDDEFENIHRICDELSKNLIENKNEQTPDTREISGAILHELPCCTLDDGSKLEFELLSYDINNVRVNVLIDGITTKCNVKHILLDENSIELIVHGEHSKCFTEHVMYCVKKFPKQWKFIEYGKQYSISLSQLRQLDNRREYSKTYSTLIDEEE